MENNSNYAIVFHENSKYPNWNGYQDWYEIFEGGKSIGRVCEALGEAFFKGGSYESVDDNNTVNHIELLAVEQDRLVVDDFYNDEIVEVYPSQSVEPLNEAAEESIIIE